MDIVIKILLGTFIICILIIVYAKISSIFRKKKKPIKTEKEIRLLSIALDLYSSTEILSEKELFERFQISDISDVNKIFSVENKDDKIFFNAIHLALSNRYRLNERNLVEISSKEFGINLSNDEKLYHVISGVKLYKEKVSVKNISYSGVKFNSRYTRAGSLSYVTNEVKNFQIEDIGKIFFTNKRILFIGDNNVSFEQNIEKILTLKLYKDAVIIIQPNRKPILFEFYQVNPIFMQDGLCEFLIMFDRLSENDINKLNKEKKTEINKSGWSEDEIKQYEKVSQSLAELRKKVNKLNDDIWTGYNVLKSKD